MCDSMDAAPSQKSSIGVQSPRVYFSAGFGPTHRSYSSRSGFGRSDRSAQCRRPWPGRLRRPPRWESPAEVERSTPPGSGRPGATVIAPRRPDGRGPVGPAERQASSGQSTLRLGPWAPGRPLGRARPGRDRAKRRGRAGGGSDGADRPSAAGSGYSLCPGFNQSYGPGGACQFSQFNPGTRLNSPTLAVTSVRPADRA